MAFSLPYFCDFETPAYATAACDAAGRIVQVTAPDGCSSSYGYTANGKFFTDMAGNTTVYENDARGELVRTVDALGHTTAYAYDALGRQVGVTLPNGQTSSTVYDSLNEKISTSDGALGAKSCLSCPQAMSSISGSARRAWFVQGSFASTRWWLTSPATRLASSCGFQPKTSYSRRLAMISWMGNSFGGT